MRPVLTEEVCSSTPRPILRPICPPRRMPWLAWDIWRNLSRVRAVFSIVCLFYTHGALEFRSPPHPPPRASQSPTGDCFTTYCRTNIVIHPSSASRHHQRTHYQTHIRPALEIYSHPSTPYALWQSFLRYVYPLLALLLHEDCQPCGNGTYRSEPCTDDYDAVCALCTEVCPGVDHYVLSPCTAETDLDCHRESNKEDNVVRRKCLRLFCRCCRCES